MRNMKNETGLELLCQSDMNIDCIKMIIENGCDIHQVTHNVGQVTHNAGQVTHNVG